MTKLQISRDHPGLPRWVRAGPQAKMRNGRRGQRDRFEDPKLPVLKMKKVAVSQEMQAASEPRKDKEPDFPLEPPEGTQPC